MALTDKLTNIADAIRGKTGGTEAMTLDQMAEAIAGIQSGGGSGAKVLTFTPAETISGNGIVVEIAHGLGKTPTALLAVNESFLTAGWGTETTHHTWILAGSRAFNFRMSTTGTTSLTQSPRVEAVGIHDTAAAYCRADAENIYLVLENYRGICAGETLTVYVWE